MLFNYVFESRESVLPYIPSANGVFALENDRNRIFGFKNLRSCLFERYLVFFWMVSLSRSKRFCVFPSKSYNIYAPKYFLPCFLTKFQLRSRRSFEKSRFSNKPLHKDVCHTCPVFVCLSMGFLGRIATSPIPFDRCQVAR